MFCFFVCLVVAGLTVVSVSPTVYSSRWLCPVFLFNSSSLIWLPLGVPLVSLAPRSASNGSGGAHAPESVRPRARGLGWGTLQVRPTFAPCPSLLHFLGTRPPFEQVA